MIGSSIWAELRWFWVVSVIQKPRFFWTVTVANAVPKIKQELKRWQKFDLILRSLTHDWNNCHSLCSPWYIGLAIAGGSNDRDYRANAGWMMTNFDGADHDC